MSEWCELPSAHDASDPLTAVIMARVISNDIGCLNVNGWSNWVAMNEKGVNPDDGKDYSDGLLVADPENTQDYYISYRYYGYMQYSRFIPAGSKVLDCSDGVYTVATYKDDEGTHFRELVNETAYLTPDGKVVVVVVNEGNTRDIKIKLDGYSNVTVYTTDSEKMCEEVYSGQPQENMRAFRIPFQLIYSVNNIEGEYYEKCKRNQFFLAFSKEAKNPPHSLPTDWEKVDLPHTWNGKDGQDGGNDYYRGKCFYAKELDASEFSGSDEYYIQFDAVNSSAEVYFNGKNLLPITADILRSELELMILRIKICLLLPQTTAQMILFTPRMPILLFTAVFTAVLRS